MADNWEDRLGAGTAASAGNWEDRLKNADLTRPGTPVSDSGFENYRAGWGKAVADIGRGLAQRGNQLGDRLTGGVTELLTGQRPFKALGDTVKADIAESRRLDAPLMATSAGAGGNMSGHVATALPAAFAPGANTLLGASVIGGLTGFVQPALNESEAALNTGVGAAAGPVGNVIGRGLAATYGLGKATLQPFFKSGQQDIVSDIVKRFAPNAAQTLANLRNGAGQLIPGSMPTAAEAAQTQGLAQLTKQVRQIPGSAAEAFAARDAANNAARVAAMRDIAGDEGKRAFFEAERSGVADQMYGAARTAGINPAALTPEALKNIAAFQARIPPEVLAKAQQLAIIKGTPMTDASSIDGMHWVKMALDGEINAAKTAGNNTLASAYLGLQKDLLAGMDKLSPAYAQARQTFAAMSKPINEMDVGQALSDKLIPAIRDFGGNANLKASGFADAMRHGDAVAQRTLGMPGATIGDVLGDTHMATLNALGRDLARAQNVTNLAKAAGSDTVQNAVSQNIIKSIAGPLGLPESLTGSTLLASVLRLPQFAASLGEKKVMGLLGDTLLDPQATAQALQRAAKQGLLTRGVNGAIKYTGPAGTAPIGGLLGSALPADR